MEFVNATRMQAGCTTALEPSGRELLVVVVKGTFRIPKPGGEVRLHEEVQVPLVEADTFSGAPGYSAPVHEVDFASRKRHCDVLLLGSAYAPGGVPTDQVAVGLRVRDSIKRFAVVGDRQWESGPSGFRATRPSPFTVKSISYDVAFGGTDTRHEDPKKHGAFMRNPVGRGFHKEARAAWVVGSPLPNTEEIGRAVSDPQGDFAPMSFGPLGRHWHPRYRFAGTYDEKWLDEYFPFLPPDFDERYYQSAPQDQQLQGSPAGAEVFLLNLTPDGRRSFVLPNFEAPIHVFPRGGKREDYTAAADTVVFEPDHERFTMTWRIARPLKKSIHEVAQVLVGRKGREWWQKREEVRFPIPVIMVPAHRAGSETGRP